MIYQKVRALCKLNKTNIKRLERELGFSNGMLAKWQTSTPKSDSLKKVADYFKVSTDYLLGENDQNDAPDSVLSPQKEDSLLAPTKEEVKAEKQKLIAAFLKLRRGNQLKLLGYIDALTDSEIEK